MIFTLKSWEIYPKQNSDKQYFKKKPMGNKLFVSLDAHTHQYNRTKETNEQEICSLMAILEDGSFVGAFRVLRGSGTFEAR